MANQNDDPLKYLPYVTLQQTWGEVKVGFFVWVALSVVFVGIGLLVDVGVSRTEALWSAIPRQVWYVAGFAVLTWLGRGGEFRITLPRSFGLWLLMVGIVSVVVLASVALPSWVVIPIYVGVAGAAASVDSLAKIGKSNYLSLSARDEHA